MKCLPEANLLLAAGMFSMAGLWLCASAQPRPSSECEQKLIGQRFNIIDKNIDDDLYEFEAIRNNQKWEIKTDTNCNVLLKRIDN